MPGIIETKEEVEFDNATSDTDDALTFIEEDSEEEELKRIVGLDGKNKIVLNRSFYLFII